jgi:hypothetical protein
MDYWWVAVPIVLILVLIAALVLLKAPTEEQSVSGDVDEATALVPVAPEVPVTEDSHEDEVFVSIALLPAATAIDKARLSEISESTVIARIAQAFPEVAETAARTVANNALKNMDVYRAILPAGQVLAKSRTMEGAYRGFARAGSEYTSNIRNHANFVKVDVSKTTAVASGVANVMNVASLVVGQYYMSEINGRLETLNKSVDRIGDFQDREFKSRVMSLIAHVGEISQFSAEIMEDETECTIKRHSLEDLRRDATELLGQVNITMSDIMQKSATPDYKEYESDIREFAIQLGYQRVLNTILEEISQLTYLLGRGVTSAERCYVLLNKYLEQSVQTRTRLGEWHANQVERLHIDLDKERRSRAGLDAFIATIPSLIDDKWKYRALEQSLVAEIGTQANPVLESRDDLKDVYDEDVEIIIKDGKYYYLHESPAGGVDNTRE